MSNQRKPITKELLLAFARGELDQADQIAIADFLKDRPELQRQVEALIAKNARPSKSSDSRGAVPRVSKPTVASGLTDTVNSGSEIRPPVTSAKPSPPSSEITQRQIEATASIDIPPELSELTEFKIVQELGRGGMGVVYLAEHVLTKRPEVLKVLAPALMANQEARRRFEQEAQVISSLDHESIVRCYSVKPLKNCIVLCMQYLPGGDLESRLTEQGRLSVREACQITIDVASGLQHALEGGVIHRDIKPSNIMLYKSRGQLRAKITDFGLGRFNDGRAHVKMTDDGRTMGTLEYISPEQSRDAAKADIRSDIYSLGCTLYHMLTGNPPFKGSPGELILAHNSSSATPAAEVRDDIPPRLSQIIETMMAKTPEQRFQTPEEVGTELSAELARLADGSSPVVDVQSKSRKHAPTTKKNPSSGKLIWFGAASIACIALCFGLWMKFGRNDEAANQGAASGPEVDNTERVAAADTPLQITIPALSPIKEGRRFSAELTANRSLDDDEEFRLADSPRGMSIDASSGKVTWDSADVGTHVVQVEIIRNIQDGTKKKNETKVEASAEFQFDVKDVELKSVPDQSMNEETTLSFLVGDFLQHQLESGEDLKLLEAPNGMSLDKQLQRLTWSTTEKDDGSHNVTIGLLYGDRTLAESSFSVSVRELNLSPALQPLAEDTRRAGETFTYTIHASDPDYPANQLSLDLIGDDALTMTIEGREIRGKVPPDRTTDLQVRVRVSDGAITADTPLNIRVRPLLPVEFPLSPELSRTPASVAMAQRLTSSQLQQPVEFSNSFRMNFRLVPGGDVDGQSIPPFYMSETEVTEAQWAAVMGKKVAGYASAPKAVDSVAEALSFCEKLSQIEGLTCRLPFEIEWEHAARAGTPGNELSHAVWKPNTDPGVKFRSAEENGQVVCYESPGDAPRTVMMGHANLFGLYDLHGNLAELCLDPPVFNFRPSDAAKLVTQANAISLDKPDRFCRGGSWKDRLNDCSFSARRQHKNDGTTGLRMVIPMPPKEKTPGGIVVSLESVDREAAAPELEDILTRHDAGAIQLACATQFGIPDSVEIFDIPFVLIPSGSITTDDRRQLSVPTPFYLARTELTQSQWKQLREKLKALGNVTFRSHWNLSSTTRHSEEFPAENMNYELARSLCEVLNKVDPLDTIREGLAGQVSDQRSLKDIRFRMPTRTEWEFACRAGLRGRFWCGEELGEFDGNLKIADQSRKAKGLDFGQTTRVATSGNPNPLGLFDMYGNVAEYCKDDDGIWAAGGSYLTTPANLSEDLFSAQTSNSGAPTTGIRLMLDLTGIKAAAH